MFRILVSGFVEFFPGFHRILEIGTDPFRDPYPVFAWTLSFFGDQILFFVMAVAKVMLCAFVKLEAL